MYEGPSATTVPRSWRTRSTTARSGRWGTAGGGRGGFWPAPGRWDLFEPAWARPDPQRLDACRVRRRPDPRRRCRWPREILRHDPHGGVYPLRPAVRCGPWRP